MRLNGSNEGTSGEQIPDTSILSLHGGRIARGPWDNRPYSCRPEEMESVLCASLMDCSASCVGRCSCSVSKWQRDQICAESEPFTLRSQNESSRPANDTLLSTHTFLISALFQHKPFVFLLFNHTHIIMELHGFQNVKHCVRRKQAMRCGTTIRVA